MNSKPSALLATTPSCPHCPAMKRLLQDLQTRKLFADVQIVDITQSPQIAEQYQIRSVPWLKIAELEFNGVYSRAELEYWATHAQTEQGIREYLSKELENGQLASAEKHIEQHPEWLVIAITLLADMEAPMQARIGLSAIIEGMTDQALLNTLLPALQQYAHHDDARVRSDTCHLLANIKSDTSKQLLRECLQDPSPEVREIAKESLAVLA